jgi:sugar lactone lactonase YvrE
VRNGTTVLVDNLGFAESPRWHDGELWFSDFFSRRVRSVEAAAMVTDRGYVPGQPSGIGFLPDGSVLVASTYSRELVRLVDGIAEVVINTSSVYPGGLNDMIVDALGHAFVSPMPERRRASELRSPPPGETPLLIFDGSAVHATDVGLSGPNGLALSEDGSTLVVAETNANRLTAFNVAADGSLSGMRLFADLGDLAPDGLCMDAEGAVWVGCVFAEQFVRVADGGNVLDRVHVPGRWAVAPALGGSLRTTLYCATALTSLPRFHQGLGTAAIETYEVSVPGIG